MRQRLDPEAVRVLVADDQDLFRRGIQAVLSMEQDIEVVAEASDGLEAVSAAEETVPDVVLLDIKMPRIDGIEAARRIRSSVPEAKILMLTASDAGDDLYEAIKAGASGYLLKEVSAAEVAAAVRAVMIGHSMLSPSMASKLVAEFGALARRAGQGQDATEPGLSERELEVLRLVARGLSNKEIGSQLFISENTVKNHVRNILEKLHMHSRMQAAMYAVRERLIEADPD